MYISIYEYIYVCVCVCVYAPQGHSQQRGAREDGEEWLLEGGDRGVLGARRADLTRLGVLSSPRAECGDERDAGDDQGRASKVDARELLARREDAGRGDQEREDDRESSEGSHGGERQDSQDVDVNDGGQDAEEAEAKEPAPAQAEGPRALVHSRLLHQ